MPRTIALTGPAPWGFRLVGGRDFSSPLMISRVSLTELILKAALGDLCPGDTILSINGDSTDSMTHMEAQNRIKACTDQLSVKYVSVSHLLETPPPSYWLEKWVVMRSEQQMTDICFHDSPEPLERGPLGRVSHKTKENFSLSSFNHTGEPESPTRNQQRGI
uniref:PDZ domain-containing protein n=1 Tax=Astyanax mexicanus TaxID=7994 RepID=A0A3B1JV42_ASTMX